MTILSQLNYYIKYFIIVSTIMLFIINMYAIKKVFSVQGFILKPLYAIIVY